MSQPKHQPMKSLWNGLRIFSGDCHVLKWKIVHYSIIIMSTRHIGDNCGPFSETPNTLVMTWKVAAAFYGDLMMFNDI